jgi:carboxylate-amine ligase
MVIEFAQSARSTLGIEWELALIAQNDQSLASLAPALLAVLPSSAPGGGMPKITSELLENTIELVTAPHRRVADAVAELRIMAREVQTAAAAHGAWVVGAGSHPFGRWSDERVTSAERYERFIDRTQWWGRNMLIWGVHVHIGIDRIERVVPLMHALVARLPHLLALSTSSPFWGGEDTGYASNRTLMFQQLPTAGLPFDIDDWADFERVINDLTHTGVIEEVSEARWDVRPSPRWGTLEFRGFDGISSLEEVAALAALTQCVVEDGQRRLDRGEELIRLQPWFVRENKWRAARYGLDAQVIVDRAGTQRALRDDIAELIDDLAPIAESLGCTAELSRVAGILHDGSSAQRQRAIAAEFQDPTGHESLSAVVRGLADQFRAGIE